MDTTATLARHIWDLPLLLQVPKLKTMPILHAANHQQYISGYIFLLSFPNRGVRWLWRVLPLTQSGHFGYYYQESKCIIKF